MSAEPRMTKNERRELARTQAQALREAQERARKRNIAIGAGVLLLAVAGLIWVVWALIAADPTAEAQGSGMRTDTITLPADVGAPSLTEVETPASANTTGGIPVSSEGVGVAPEGNVTVDVYADFVCPYCGLLEQVNGEDLIDLTAEPGVTVIYHPVAIMDYTMLGSYYPTRVANAAAIVADQDPDNFVAFYQAMFADGVQPAEGTTGLSDEQIASIAQGVGVPAEVTDTFTDTVTFKGHEVRKFAPWVLAATATLPLNPSTDKASTPTMLINGERWSGDFLTAGQLRLAVEATVGE